ncbi:hypothetical protein SISSUDRAFT_1025828 [Sistotremastrum suecicum HHB10207 ss-3]|uniref:T6SS Phospholipase effector Tle1-like catalytic domain-containing protein n=1 Tax=Sistotremastrum suecicum HHB10207 ss-3 TaxID=1314776 RepID=A0A166A7V6_9AGAM|nr:hypothetical protein SISSUDRAFT_1025828 [Sistotremastrum suecicum HHB10207 ss-3]
MAYQRLADNDVPAPDPSVKSLGLTGLPHDPVDRTSAASNTTLTNGYFENGNSNDAKGKGVNSPITPLELNTLIPPTIPHDQTCWPPITPRRARTLVLCFDGTGDQFDDDNSNIVRLFQLLKKNDPTRQMCYYQAGIGTYTAPSVNGAISGFVAAKLDEAIAYYLHAHVQEGYEFLMQNYVHGDKICLFGFSRGAYTARALAGMVHSVGLLPQWNTQQVPFAWKCYTDGSPKGLVRASEFKAAFSSNVIIDFVGVFDTVASVGIISKELPFAASNRAIRVFRHALALDERRVKFKANHFHNPPKIEVSTEKKIKAHQITGSLTQQEALDGKRVDPTGTHKPKRPETDSKEVWFAGCHCDVGGGSVSNKETVNLAMIPLRWMIQETIATETGILFDLAQLDLIGLTPHHLPTSPDVKYPQLVEVDPPVPRTPSIPVQEVKDAVEPRFDQLALAWAWWILELWPLRTKALDKEGRFVKGYLWPNLGHGRCIPDPNKYPLNIHRSVKYRAENFEWITPAKEGDRRKKAPYQPKAYWMDENNVHHHLDILHPETLPKINWVD